MGWFLPVALAVSTVSKIAGSIHDARTAKKNTNLTIAENKRLAELQYKREQEQIQAQNQYNSPASQMQRFKAAGLNPALIYSQGTPGLQTQIPRYDPPTVEYKYKPYFTGNELNDVWNYALAAQSIKNQIAQGKVIEAEATMKQALSKYADILAESTVEKSFNEWQAEKMRRIFQEEEFTRFFEKRGNEWFLKDGVEDLFINNLMSKWMKEPTALESSQQSILNQKTRMALDQKFLELQNMGLPWMQPILNFVRLLIGK